jgi:glutamate-1-semialdehyde 2,1-aminomutase
MTTPHGEVKLEHSQQLLKEASGFSPMGVPNCKWWAPNAFFVSGAKGSRIYDVDGNEYLDYWCGAGPHILGHAHPEVSQAAIEAIQEGNVQFAMPSGADVVLAEKLSEYIPCAEMVALCATGTDAITFAIRIAREYTGRSKVVKFDGGYQGWSDIVGLNNGAISSYGDSEGTPLPISESAGVPTESIANTIVLPYNDLEAVATRLHQEREQVACLLVEPMVHSSNLIPRPGFLEGLRQICDDLGIVLVFDEIVTGFRHGLSGGQGVMGVTPDLGTFGKAMASGYVIAAVAGKRELMSLVSPQGKVRVAGTFGGNALGVATAVKTLEILSRPGFYPKLMGLGDTLRDGVNMAIQRLGVKARCDGFGSVWCMYFSDQEPRNHHDVVRYKERGGAQMDNDYRAHMFQRGIFIRPQAVNRSYISAAHSTEDIQRTIDATVGFLEENTVALK